MPRRVARARDWNPSVMVTQCAGSLGAGSELPPDSTEPMKYCVTSRPSVSAVLSAWVIWPIFSSSVIWASSASTSGDGWPAARAAGTAPPEGPGALARGATQAAGASAAAAARNLRRVGRSSPGGLVIGSPPTVGDTAVAGGRCRRDNRLHGARGVEARALCLGAGRSLVVLVGLFGLHFRVRHVPGVDHPLVGRSHRLLGDVVEDVAAHPARLLAELLEALDAADVQRAVDVRHAEVV